MKSTSLLCSLFLGLAFCHPARAAFLIDFNSNQSGGGTPVAGNPADPANAVHNEAGYQSYHASHETPAQFIVGTYNTAFALTGPAVVTLLPQWPNTTAAGVQQMIGRSQAQADTWIGNNVNLLRDWLGTDSRTATASGGNGAWDGTNGTPTYLTVTLGGLPAATYDMTSFHHDVENMNSFFAIEISTDGGLNYGTPLNGRMTNSLAGGTPPENEIFPGTAPNVAGGDPADLSSTMNYQFTANGINDVVLRFAPLAPDNGTTVHQAFFGINGFQLEQVPEPSAAVLLLSALALGLRRRR